MYEKAQLRSDFREKYLLGWGCDYFRAAHYIGSKHVILNLFYDEFPSGF